MIFSERATRKRNVKTSFRENASFFCFLEGEKNSPPSPQQIASKDFSGRYQKVRASDTEESDWSRPTVVMPTGHAVIDPMPQGLLKISLLHYSGRYTLLVRMSSDSYAVHCQQGFH
ncbi:unnamed protein product [Larinioides sclopetarius]|uniref:Uncharacterized protein n=1 Tax=Larinioides sclopetarius TaxID=280406 RepID=A0AAV2APT8_9ARAC